MRKMLIVSALTMATALPTDARADLLFTPYTGINFGGSSVDKRANVGASLAWLGTSGLGFELDFGFIPDFFEERDLPIEDPLGSNNVTTVMGNVLFGRAGSGIQPYVVAGAGLLRSRVGSFGDLFDATDNGFGVNAGAGVRVGAGRFSVRGDVRYFRQLTDVDLIFDDALGDFGFWRAAAGLSIGF